MAYGAKFKQVSVANRGEYEKMANRWKVMNFEWEVVDPNAII